MDETTLQVNQEERRKASANAYMWVQRGGPPGQQAVLFDYAPAVPGMCLYAIVSLVARLPFT
ncbi:hypothetical protein HMEPL2_21830 [Vreelandella aquamarina]|jgi:transposase|uniref:Transposase IS66 central domain-containing protein n=1 Tax=Vreelandella aquamarina TaxID=77097 RepID=A0A6F8XCB6_9GAMM|nr:IS66 family transposase [Halomonas meridiana]BCB71832.1 hypothetical protein HMEPL2_21830 [Halomonas meridiana]